MHSGNPALRALLDETGTTNAGLARAVVAAGAAEGVHLGTSATTVKRMLAGAQPRWPVPRLVADVLSRRLHRAVGVTECGFADRAPAPDDRYDGLDWSGTLDGTVRTVVELSGRDMKRRSFLLGTAFSAAAFAEPALLAVTTPPAEAVARTAGRRLGLSDVEIIREHLAHLRRLDHRFGAGRVHEQVVQVLHHQSGTVLHGSYSEHTGRALLAAVAELSDLAAGTAHDIGRHALAQRYYIQALNLALSARNRLFGADVLVRMSHLTVLSAGRATTREERLRTSRHALALARSGRTVAAGTETPMLATALHAVEARSLALLGDAPATRLALREAEKQYQRIRPENEPDHLGYAEAQFTGDMARCLTETGDTTEPIRLFEHAIATNSPTRVRSLSILQADLASAHLVAGDHERAARHTHQALRTAGTITSTRTHERLSALRTQIRAHTPSRPLTEADERLTTALAHPPP